MVILKHLNHQKLLISKRKSLLLYDVSSDTTLEIQLPDENENITGIATSKCGNYFAVLRNKQVIIYDNTLKIVKNFILKRAAHSITLFGTFNTLVADKTGDVYLYKTNDDENNGTLLLGHLSMLLNIVLTDNEKFLITCDRDEKIRVSHYPNTYNIERFCLGHKEFVTKIVLLENNYLLSASGDGKILLWDYLKGNILHCINTNEFINEKTIINNFVKRMDLDKCEVTCLPIVDMQIKKLCTTHFVVVQIYKLKDLQVYSLDISNGGFNSKLVQNISFQSEIETFSLNQELFVSTRDGINMFVINDNVFNKVTKHSLEMLKNCEGDDNIQDISTLYKRKFDNVQEYLERKRLRIEGK